MEKLVSFLTFLLCLVLKKTFALSGESFDQELLRKAKNADSFDFPRVYTAIVPKSLSVGELSNDIWKERVNDGYRYFVAKVDLLHFRETEIPSRHSENRNNFIKIYFLIESQEQLEDMLSFAADLDYRLPKKLGGVNTLPLLESIEMDVSETFKLKDSLSYSFSKDKDVIANRKLEEYSLIPGYGDEECYKSIEGTLSWMDAMVERAESIPDLSIDIIDIGDSYLKTQNADEGYDIFAMKITGNGVQSRELRTEKGVFFLMSGLHARELTPTELVIRWIEMLVNGYGTNADLTALLDHTEIHAVIQANPDGRALVELPLPTQIGQPFPQRMRRKNVNPGRGLPCSGRDLVGVDLNRNFPFNWGLASGSSNNRCDNTYRGQSPASEPETQAIMQYVESIFPAEQGNPGECCSSSFYYNEDTTTGIFIDVHSYGEVFIYPWAHKNEVTGNDSSFRAMANKFNYFTGYKPAGPQNNFFYEVSGAADEWAYGTLGVAGFTIELGTAFLQNCTYFRESILEGNLQALTYAAKSSTLPYKIPKGPEVTDISVTVSEDGNTLIVGANASDSAFVTIDDPDDPSSQQNIAEIRAFIDVHPYDILENGEFPVGEALTDQSVSMDISGLSDGKHFVCFQAIDTDGYKGAVSAEFFTIGGTSTTSEPTVMPETLLTVSPTGSPIAPVADPTSAPVVATTATPEPSVETTKIEWVIKEYTDMSAKVGDTIEFTYASFHNVYIHPSGNCSTTDSIEVGSVNDGSNGEATYTFTEDDAGTTITFVCQIPGHCEAGQILNINVASIEPVTSPPETGGGGGFGICFSGSTLVQDVLGKGPILMSDLQIGDQVKTVSNKGKETYETVYSFGHYNPTQIGDFLQITTTTSNNDNRKLSVVEMSNDHLILLSNGNTFVPASTLKVGDELVTTTEAAAVVSQIKPVRRQGVYAPFTTSGTIVVSNDSIVASSFVTLQEDKETITINGIPTIISAHTAAYLFETIHRIAYKLGMIKNESYSFDGISHWVETPRAFFLPLLNDYSMLIQLMILIPGFALLAILKVVEDYHCKILILTAAAVVFHQKRKKVFKSVSM